jgi:hypothetical protein
MNSFMTFILNFVKIEQLLQVIERKDTHRYPNSFYGNGSFLKADSSSTTQDIPNILWNLKMSLPCPRYHITGSYSEPDSSTPYPGVFLLISISISSYIHLTKTNKNSVALVRKRTIPTERPPLVDEVSANFSG